MELYTAVKRGFGSSNIRNTKVLHTHGEQITHPLRGFEKSSVGILPLQRRRRSAISAGEKLKLV